MNILGHIIDEGEIIGVGPLELNKSATGYYSTAKLSFLVYLKNYAAKIESESFLQDMEHPRPDCYNEYTTFKKRYFEIREKVESKVY